MQEAGERNWLTQEEAVAFVGVETEFYLGKWKKYADGFFKGWNWAAMLFGVEWLAYRKMYREAVLFYLLTLALGIALALSLAPLGIRVNAALFRDCLRVLMGLFGNALYRKKAMRLLKQAAALDDTQRLAVFEAKGGVSTASVVVCLVLGTVAGAVPMLLP